MNKVILIGRIGKDPETFTFDNGNVKSSFTLATTESYKDGNGEWQEKTEWHNVIVYRETKLKKGDLIAVEGKIMTRSWEANGEKKYITEIIAQKTQLLNRKATQQTTTEPQPKVEPKAAEPEQQIDNDGLPF